MTTSDRYRICVVCTGNICRSPMGEFVLRELFEDAGLGDEVEVVSAGTTAWEEGNPADPRTLAVLREHGHREVGGAQHVAQVFDRESLPELDLVLAADAGHFSTLRRAARSDSERAKVFLFRSFDPDAPQGAEMADPYYGDERDFEQTYAEVIAASAGVVEHVRRML